MGNLGSAGCVAHFTAAGSSIQVSLTIIHIGPPLLPILYSLGGATERRIRELATRQAQAGSV